MTRLENFYRNANQPATAETYQAVLAGFAPTAKTIATAERRLALMGYLEALDGNTPADIAEAKDRFMDDYCVPATQFKVALKAASQHLL